MTNIDKLKDLINNPVKWGNTNYAFNFSRNDFIYLIEIDRTYIKITLEFNNKRYTRYYVEININEIEKEEIFQKLIDRIGNLEKFCKLVYYRCVPFSEKKITIKESIINLICKILHSYDDHITIDKKYLISYQEIGIDTIVICDINLKKNIVRIKIVDEKSYAYCYNYLSPGKINEIFKKVILRGVYIDA